mgnify:CR=1 FL=1
MNTYIFVKRYINEKILFVLFILLSVVLAIIGMVIPYITGAFIDFLVYLKGKDDLFRYCMFYSVICVLSVVINFALSRISMIIVKKAVYALQIDVIKTLEKTYILKVEYDSSAELSQKISYDSNALLNFFVGSIQNIILNVVLLIGPTIFLIKFNYKIALSLILLAVIYFFIYKLFKSKLMNANFKVKEHEASYFAELNCRITKLSFIKNNAIYNFFDERLNKVFACMYRFSLDLQAINYLFFSLDKIIVMVSQIILFAYGGMQILDGSLTVGRFTVISTYFTMIISSIRYFFGYGKEYQEIEVSKNRIFKILKNTKEEFGHIKCDKINSLEIIGADFEYNLGKKIFSNFSYKFLTGYIYILRGANGAGKSTLLKILSTLFYNIDSGVIRINGVLLDLYDLDYLRRNRFGVLEQSPVFVDGSIRENLFTENIDYVLLEKLREILNLNEFMQFLNNDIDMVVKEKEKKLSGGEKQKIALLRTLLKKSDVLILDEPSSSIDEMTKIEMIKYLKEIKKDKIIIISTHDGSFYDLGDYFIEI